MDPTTCLENALAGDPGALLDLKFWLMQGGFAPRCQLHPSTDWWMRGARYGTVTAVRIAGYQRSATTLLKVTLDDGRKIKLRLRDILEAVR